MEVGGDDLPKRKETKELHVWSVNGEPGMVITWTISIHERILREGNNQRGAWAGGEIGNSSFRLAALWERKTQGFWSR